MPLVRSAFALSLGIAGMTVSNQQLLRETESNPITSMVNQCQLWQNGHVAQADPACEGGHKFMGGASG